MGLNNAPKDDRYKQGLYIPKFPEKYIGDPTNIFYRSSLEKKFCIYADINPKILKWGCECFEIPYTLKSLGNPPKITHHRYYPDFYLEVSRPDLPQLVARFLIEVKPEAETKAPVLPKSNSLKKIKSAEYQLVTYNKNVYKWVQAIDWCKARDIEFRLVIEENFDKTLRSWAG